MAGQRYELFQQAKAQLRLHPELTNQEIAERIGAKSAELDIIEEARKDHQAAHEDWRPGFTRSGPVRDS